MPALGGRIECGPGARFRGTADLKISISIAGFVLYAVLALLPAPAWSYSFVPDQFEFASWPKHCQARYVTTSIGSTSQFAASVSAATIEAARGNIGSQAFEHVHHFCAGMLYLRRARTEADEGRRKWLLGEAFNESIYTFNRVIPGGPVYASIAATLAQIERARGNDENALQYLTTARQVAPSDAMTHLALAIFFRDSGHLLDARKTLEEGFEATERQSYEIAYNLGLICVELQDISCAVEKAQFVYDAGFPLPGLKNRLEKLGHWPR